MKKKTFNKWLLVAMVAFGIGSVLVIRDAAATGDQDHTCQGGHNCNDGGDIDIDVDADATADAQADANADSSSDASAQADASNGDQTVNFNGPSELKTTGRAYTSSGDATADCQKFGGISSAWLGGALGLGLNFTDKECRQLKVYDRLVARGLVTVANATLCQTRTLRKLYGRDGQGQCVTALTDAYSASQGDQGDAIRDEMDDLRKMVRELSLTSRQAAPDSAYQDDACTESERVAACPDCEEQATRAFKACVAK